MKFLTNFAGQNWLITPASLAVGERPPASIRDQKWLLVLTGVVLADFKGIVALSGFTKRLHLFQTWRDPPIRDP